VQQQINATATPAVAAGALVVGLVVVIVGQFFLDSLADTGEAWHWIQHGMLFAGGLAVGFGVTTLYARGQAKA
jgi:hypothetical protein